MNPFDSINPSMLRDIEEMQRVSDLINRDWRRTVEMITNIDFEWCTELSKNQLRGLSGLDLNALAGGGETHRRMIKDVLRDVKPTMLSLTNASVLAANAALADARWLDSHLTELWAHIPDGEQKFTDERVEADLKALNELIRAALGRTRPMTRPNFFNIMGVILTVYLAYIATGHQQEMEARLTAKIEESGTAIIEEVQDQFRALEPKHDYAWFIVTREVLPGCRRRTRSQIVGKIVPWPTRFGYRRSRPKIEDCLFRLASRGAPRRMGAKEVSQESDNAIES